MGKCRLPVRRLPSKLCAILDLSRRLRMDEPKSSISPFDSHGRIGADATSIAADVSRPADAGDTVGGCPLSPVAAAADCLSERSMIVYCGNERELEEGFCIA